MVDKICVPNVWRLFQKNKLKFFIFAFLGAWLGVSLTSIYAYDGKLQQQLVSLVPLFLLFMLSAGTIYGVFVALKQSKLLFKEMLSDKEMPFLAIFISFTTSPLFYIIADKTVQKEDVRIQTLAGEIFGQFMFTILCCLFLEILWGIFMLMLGSFFSEKSKKEETTSPEELEQENTVHNLVSNHPQWQEIKQKAIFLLNLNLPETEASEVKKALKIASASLETYTEMYEPTEQMQEELDTNLQLVLVVLNDFIDKYNDKKLKQLKRYQDKLKQVKSIR